MKEIEIPEGYTARIEGNKVILEPKESEDERVRKWLIEMVEEIRKANPTNAEHNGNCSEAIAYLEKQEHIATEAYNKGFADGTVAERESEELEKQKEQPKQEWSEENEPSREMILAIWELGNAWKCCCHPTEFTQLEYIQKHWKESTYYDKLKSLRPQPHWKPSEEQMRVMEYYMHALVSNENKEILFSLYSDLKKLM